MSARAAGEPYVWVGATSGVSGANDDVVLPPVGTDHDWELELGVVMGSEAYQVSEDDAMGYVAGYTICNDLTTRSRSIPKRHSDDGHGLDAVKEPSDVLSHRAVSGPGRVRPGSS